MEIPLFPLHTVLMPGAPLPLHIFEPRYRALVADCLAAAGPFGVVGIESGQEVGDGRVTFASVGTLAEIREASRYPDGRFDIVTVGTSRFRLSRVDAGRRAYLVGIGELLPELLGDAERAARLARRVRSRFVRYLALLQSAALVDREPAGEAGKPPSGTADPGADSGGAGAAQADLQEVAARLAPPDDPTALAHIVAGLVHAEMPRRQRMLEAATTEERLADLDALLGREISLLARRLGPYDPDLRVPAVRRN